MSLWRRVVLAVVCACVVGAVQVGATSSGTAAAPGSQPPEPDLGAIVLDNGDVPPGFELDAQPLSAPPHTGQRRYVSGSETEVELTRRN